MTQTKRTAVLLPVGVALLLVGCPEKVRPPTIDPTRLPQLKWTGPDQGFPPRVAGATNVKVIRAEPPVVRLTNALILKMRTAALKDPRVRSGLGKRFAFIMADELETKNDPEDRHGPVPARLVFFNYDANRALWVDVLNDRVRAMQSRRYQPSLGLDEQKKAIAAASRALGSRVKGLWPDAILTGYRKIVERVAYVTFSRNKLDDLPLLYARYSFTKGKVFETGSLEKRIPLPAIAIERMPQLKWTGPSQGFPPRVAGATNVKTLRPQPVINRLTPSVVRKMRSVALKNPRVRAALGRRFAFLTAQPLETKGVEPDPNAARLVFFNYGGNTAVWVAVAGNSVRKVQPRRYQPSLGLEEQKMAIRFATRALGRKVRGLRPDAILSGHGRMKDRIAYVTFSKDKRADLPLFFARFSLSTNKILKTGSIK